MMVSFLWEVSPIYIRPTYKIQSYIPFTHSSPKFWVNYFKFMINIPHCDILFWYILNSFGLVFGGFTSQSTVFKSHLWLSRHKAYWIEIYDCLFIFSVSLRRTQKKRVSQNMTNLTRLTMRMTMKRKVASTHSNANCNARAAGACRSATWRRFLVALVSWYRSEFVATWVLL